MILPALVAGAADGPRRRVCPRAARRPKSPTIRHEPGRAGSFFLWLGGADSGLITSRHDRVQHTAAGGAVLTTAVLAGLAMFGAAMLAFRASVPVAAAVGLGWSLAIGNLDRWMVATAVRSAGAVAARLALALVLSAVISEPAALWIFAPEIRAELAVQATRDAQAARADAEALVQDARARVETERERLDETVAEAEAAVAAAEARYAAEVSGAGGTGRSGEGPAAAAYRADADAARDQLTAARDRERTEGARLDAEDERLTAEAAEVAERQATAAEAGDGLLAQMTALHHRIAREPVMLVARVALAVVVLVVELLPLILGSVRRSGHDERVRVQHARIVSRARVELAEIAAIERARLAELEDHAPGDPGHSPETHPSDQRKDSAASDEDSREPEADSRESSPRESAPVMSLSEALKRAHAMPPPDGKNCWTSRPLAALATELRGAPVSQKAANNFLKSLRET